MQKEMKNHEVACELSINVLNYTNSNHKCKCVRESCGALETKMGFKKDCDNKCYSSYNRVTTINKENEQTEAEYIFPNSDRQDDIELQSLGYEDDINLESGNKDGANDGNMQDHVCDKKR